MPPMTVEGAFSAQHVRFSIMCDVDGIPRARGTSTLPWERGRKRLAEGGGAIGGRALVYELGVLTFRYGGGVTNHDKVQRFTRKIGPKDSCVRNKRNSVTERDEGGRIDGSSAPG